MVLRALLAMSLLLLPSGSWCAAVTWTGNVDRLWITPGNWNTGVRPGVQDDVTIPPDSGPIFTAGTTMISLKSLDVQNTAGGGGTHIQGPADNVELSIAMNGGQVFGGKFYLGTGNSIGKLANPNGHGGELSLSTRVDDMTINGTVFGGDGGTEAGGKGRYGGLVIVSSAGNLRIDGAIQGAKGGQGMGGNAGGAGGDVRILCEGALMRTGSAVPGVGGAGNPEGDEGEFLEQAKKRLTVIAGITSGRSIVMQVFGDPLGNVELLALAPGAIHAQETIKIGAGSGAAYIDLRGNSGSAPRLTAGGSICLFGQVLLDSGVTLSQICEPDPIVSDVSCVAPIGTPLTMSVMAVLCCCLGVVLLRSRSAKVVRSLVALLLACACARPCEAFTTQIQQVDWLRGSGGYLVQDSEWGVASVQFTPADSALLTHDSSGWFGYLQVLTNSSSGVGSNNWAVGNKLMLLASPQELEGRLPEVMQFDLGVPRGTDVGTIRAHAFLTSAPLAVMPLIDLSPPVFAVPVIEVEWLFGGEADVEPVVYDGAAGKEEPGPAVNYKINVPAGHVRRSAKIKIKESDLEKVSEEINGCGPGAAGRGIKYLKTQFNIATTLSAQELYEVLKTDAYMKTSLGAAGDGTAFQRYLEGANKYSTQKCVGYTASRVLLPGTADLELDGKNAVALHVYWGKVDGKNLGGHVALLTEIITYEDASSTVSNFEAKLVDDGKQGDGTADNRTHWLWFKNTGDNDFSLEGGGCGGAGAALKQFSMIAKQEQMDQACVPVPGLSARSGVCLAVTQVVLAAFILGRRRENGGSDGRCST